MVMRCSTDGTGGVMVAAVSHEVIHRYLISGRRIERRSCAHVDHITDDDTISNCHCAIIKAETQT